MNTVINSGELHQREGDGLPVKNASLHDTPALTNGATARDSRLPGLLDSWSTDADNFLDALTAIARRRWHRPKSMLCVIRAARYYRVPISEARRIYSDIAVAMASEGVERCI